MPLCYINVLESKKCTLVYGTKAAVGTLKLNDNQNQSPLNQNHYVSDADVMKSRQHLFVFLSPNTDAYLLIYL